MFAEFKPTALLEQDEFPEQNSPLDIAGAFDPFLSLGAIDSDAEDWMELLAYSWGVDWTSLDTSASDELDAA
ncbi:MAG TPA: hypothetical protein V6D16_08070 [Candidatus Obscuribacterales bacterium]